MDKNTQQPVAWRNAVKLLVSEYWDIAYREGKTGSNFADQANDVLRRIDEHISTPPVPRDVLIQALDDMMYHCACEWSNSDPDKMVELGRGDIERIADRYASQVQPERCQCCGYLVTESEHKGCLRAGRAAIQPEPVNQHLLAALKACDEAMSYMSEYDIPITLPDMVRSAIAAAEAAQKGGEAC